MYRFRVANHRSFRDEQELSLVAVPGPGERKPGAQEIPPTVRVAAVVGANASGKSNLVGAMRWMVRMIAESHSGEGGGVPRQPYGWDGESRERPTTCEVDFSYDGVRCTYGFAADDEAIREEWLLWYPSGRAMRLFARAADGYQFGRALSGEKERIRKATRADALYLGVAAASEHPLLSDIHHVLVEGATFVDQSGSDESARLDTLLRDEAERARVMALVRLGDVGVDEVRRTPDGLELRHGSDDAWLPLSAASSGTRAWLALVAPLLDTLRRGSLLVVDDLDARLHPLLALALVRLFKDAVVNRRQAQLIYTTCHDATLSGVVRAEDLLARDEVWFTEKDRAGATSLYALAEFRSRAGDDVETGYAHGRYGAVPYRNHATVRDELATLWDPPTSVGP